MSFTPIRTPHIVVPMLTLVVGLLFLAGCGSSGPSASASAPDPSSLPTSDDVNVRLGYFPNVTHAPALLGIQRGLFDTELSALGATLETKTFNAGPEALASLLSGALDIAYIGPNPAVNAFQKTDGTGVRVVAGSTSGGARLIVSPDITTAEDLRGKTVATPQLGGTQDVALRHWLGEQGLETDTTGGGDVSVKPQANADTLAAFKAGQIAGAWVPAPWDTRLVEEGGGTVLVDEATLWPAGRFTTTVILVRKAFLHEHPAAVNAILKAHLTALESITADPAAAQADANAAIDAATGRPLSAALIASAWEGLLFTPDPMPATVETSAEDAVGLGLGEPTELGPLFDLSLLNALLPAAGQPQGAGS